MASSDTELLKLFARRHQLAITSAGMTHMLDHKKIDESARIDAEEMPRVAFEQV